MKLINPNNITPELLHNKWTNHAWGYMEKNHKKEYKEIVKLLQYYKWPESQLTFKVWLNNLNKQVIIKFYILITYYEKIRN